MYKKLLLIIIFSCLFLILFIGNSQAYSTDKMDVKIDPGDYVSDQFWISSKGDEIDVSVDSNIPINVYIVTSDNYNRPSKSDIEKAKYADYNETYTEFTYRIPDDQTYFLVIENPNTSIATVDYEYTENYDEDIDSAASAFCGMAICLIIIIVIIFIFIFIFYYATRNRRMPPPYYPPQQPYYPYPQYPSYPPPQQPPQYYYPPRPPGY
jgi:hypothetical protein